ncbi:hypothetical protein FOXB_14309 [Fusarium oxysporum f. sp. conglutinans Fo5176]|uniref:DUF7924 domain-containing protein n=1 Tax=Fusarium oxysporum (strain Fo5176) TaxID=660025 RepID=F9G6M7_FUSOF|nr:hypothetical protein FOXB_14309 [Fusarium oxysporum f. sp. conglutinans Fo5176]
MYLFTPKSMPTAITVTHKQLQFHFTIYGASHFTMPPNQREIQRQLMKKYNIIFDGPIDSITSPQWPGNCNTIFDHIRRLGRTDYSEYRESISADFTRFPWRHQVQQRAKRITKIAKRCLESRKNESGWRLALESEVMARFSVEIACRNCRGRLWRSEQEVDPTTQTAEEDDPNSLRARQRRRQSCTCKPNGFSRDIPEQGISPLFDDRAEEAIIYSSELRAELPKREHRPDRVFGLQVTERLSRLLNYAEDIRSSPFRLDGDPLVFPFLVIEAKSEKGSDAFTYTQVQTAFAIRELLSIQQELAHVANENEEWDGGPLVWFLSYKGEQWRVFAAYIHTTPDKISYRVVRLWSGGVDSLDGALQLLLIIDYIADWARDIYREGIARSLQRLAPTDSESLRRDDDIFSMAGNIRSWIASNFDRSHDAKDRPMGDSLCKFDCGSGVFRDARFVESQCIGLVITHHNVESFLRTATTDKETRGLISVLLESLERPCLAKGQVLNDLELMWTDTDRNLSEILHPEDVFYVVVVATFYLSPGWKPTRELTYLAVSKKLVQDSIRSPAGPLSSTIQLEKAPMVEDLESFRGLLHMSAEDNLNACLYNFCLRTDKPTRARRSEVNYVWKTLPTVASDDADRELQDRVLRACARPSTRNFDLQLRPDVLDQTEWPWADDSSFKTMKESNKELIIVRRAAQVTYFQADMCIYVLDTSLAQRGIPQALFSCPPETHVLMFKFDEDPSNIDDIGRLMDHFEKLKKELRQYRGFGLLSKWKHVTTGWAKDQNTGSLDFASNRPFIRHSYQAPLSSTLLKEEDYGSDRLSPMPFHSGVKQANDATTRTAGPATRTAESVHRPAPEGILQNTDNTRDGDDRANSSTMSERRKEKRPMGAADEPDEAESSAHAERRARQEREVAQRFNSDFLSDEELEEVLAKGTLS